MALTNKRFAMTSGCVAILILMSLLYAIDAPAYVRCQHIGVCEFLEIDGILETHEDYFSPPPSGVDWYIFTVYISPTKPCPVFNILLFSLNKYQRILVNQKHNPPSNYLTSKTLQLILSSIIKS